LGGALDIKTQYSQWCNFAELPLTGQAFNFVEINHIKLNLAHAFFLFAASNIPITLFYLYPSHAADFTVDHKSK
jgi:hypothetical protein